MSYITEYILIGATDDQVRAANLIYEQTQNYYSDPPTLFKIVPWDLSGGSKFMESIALTCMNYFHPGLMAEVLREVHKDFPFGASTYIVVSDESYEYDEDWRSMQVTEFINKHKGES